MNPKNVSDILDVLAVKFGTTASHLWEVLVRQVYLEAGQAVVWLVGFSLLMAYCGRALAKDTTKSYDPTTKQVILWIGVGLSALCILIELPWCFNAITYTLNPEYGALKLVGEALSGK